MFLAAAFVCFSMRT